MSGEKNNYTGDVCLRENTDSLNILHLETVFLGTSYFVLIHNGYAEFIETK